MRLKSLRALAPVFSVVALLAASPVCAGPALETVKGAAERAVQVLRDPNLLGKEKKKERVRRIKEVVDSIFDYQDMARRALGSHWRRRTPAEQEEFTGLFRNFIENIYSDKMDLYEGEKIVFGKEVVEQDFAQVDSSVVTLKGEEFIIVYKLHRVDGKWKVYDAVIENISVINNYRSQFDRVINSSSYQDLVKRLREKLAVAG
ncbi:MAG TPA: ABC transporter substrate-binding protein [Candidatus Binatia bacterium]|jgi:phospholipid transport system substrate-binding protein